jgi:hypothetical protein
MVYIKNMSMIQKIKHYFFYPRFRFSRFQFNLVAIFFLTVGFTFGSYFTLSKIFPNVFALNDTAKIWTFNTANSDDYTKSQISGETVVAVDNDGAHPTGGTVGANEFTNPSFATGNEGGDADNWSVAAVPPSGWVEIPGNSDFYSENYNGNFLLMKYEAKAWDTQEGAVITDGGYGQSGGWAGTNSQTRYQARSIADGRPWVYIAQNHSTNFDAREACTALGEGYHLVNNNEWMTVARNATNVANNWTNSEVGNGALFRGNSNTSASLDGSDPLSGINTRTLTLSNGGVIWDLAGNVWDWTDDVQSTTINTTSGWVEWNHTNVAEGAIDLYGPSGGYLSAQGMGQVYGGALNNAFRRGGYWNTSTGAGVFALYLYSAPGSQNYSIGFRCASDPVAISQSFSSSSGRAAGGNTITIGLISDGKIYQSINVGDSSTYNLSVYVYDLTETEGEEITSSDAQLYYNGSVIDTTYTCADSNCDSGAHWWKLSGTLTGANESREYGVLVKTGKTVKVDDFTLSKQGAYSVYTTSAYSNAQVNSWDTFCEGTLTGSTCTTDATTSTNSTIKYQICTDEGLTCQSGNSWKYWDGNSWETASNSSTHVNTAAELNQEAMQALPIVSQKISVKAVFTFGGSDVPYLPHISIGLTTDTTAPSTNASAVTMTRSNGGSTVASNGWTKNTSPYFSWTAGADNSGGSGIKGYCLYLGTDNNGNPATSKGLLGTSPVSTDGTTCQFIVSSTSIDLATSSYKGSTWLSSSNSPYYLNIKAIDNSGNTYGGDSAKFQFRFDNTAPENVTYVNCASGSFSNVADMNFSWPTGESSPAAIDDNAGIFGWQYQINSTEGTWRGTTEELNLGVGNYIATGVSSRTLTEAQDGDSIVSGSNVVYFRSVDASGNSSSDGTIRTCNLVYGGAAPYFGNNDTVTVTPSTSTSNSYALSWPAATPTAEQSVAHYYYMINTSPPSTLATLQGNAATYINNNTARKISATTLANVNKGTNTVYVVAVDNADTPNYSPSNYITGTFTLNSTDPDNVGDLVASDSSIKSQSQWNVTLTWTAPSYQGAGNLTYLVYRSSDGTDFTQVGSTSGLSYVDNTPSSAQYYYKVYTKDGANAQSSGTNAVTITPSGKWTSPPSLNSEPEASSVTTKKATITWSTSRASDSKVQYGTESGSYGEVEPSNSDQVTSHSIQLTGLNPGTTYYYKTKWTDEDGNTGTSEEKNFTTAAAPTVKDVTTKNIGLSSAIVEFTSINASKVKIYYGTSTNFGGVKEIPTSTSETTFTAELTGLLDGTKYYYKINTFDSESSEYEGTILNFTTLPRPKISKVRIQQVANAVASTILVTWVTNTEVSSIVTYYPQGKAAKARDEVNVALTKGEHRMILRGLYPQTNYILLVKGRDKIGNEAVSDSQRFTTATDTRPPQIADLSVEGVTVPATTSTAQESTAQLIVSWNTDEPATSQIEFGEGTGTTYSSKTQEDSNLTYNHLVIISSLAPSKVYHLRAISKDKVGNIGHSIDTVVITPKATENALNLVITNLQEAFGFIRGMR